jgi:glycosyltransferase involved in cell wall biosynthesis
MRKVLIIQAEMKHYRIPFFAGLHAELQREQVQLTVAYSNSNRAHASRADRAELPPPAGKKVSGWWIFDRLLYQPLWKHIAKSDLIIVGPEIKYLINPTLLLLSALGIKKVAYWGLGPNKRSDRSPVAEWIKQHFYTQVDWWFAYTASVAAYLRDRGMPAEKITDVCNATDTAELAALLKDIPDEEVLATKVDLTGEFGSQIGLYCGLIGKIKDIPLLLDAAREIKQQRPRFHLVLIGNGPDRFWLETAIQDEPWIHYLGSKYGRESALYYKMADLFLLAGTAGLAIVDSFAAGLPVIATDMPTHPPEISYIVDGHNGRLAPHQAEALADVVAEVLGNPATLEALRDGARASGLLYSMESMIENFGLGIQKCFAYYGDVSSTIAADLVLPGAELKVQSSSTRTGS